MAFDMSLVIKRGGPTPPTLKQNCPKSARHEPFPRWRKTHSSPFRKDTISKPLQTSKGLLIMLKKKK